MANWCTTDYQIEGNLEKVSKLFGDITRVLNMDRSSEAGSPNANWLRYIAEELLHKDYKRIPCRGSIDYIDDETFQLESNKYAFKMSTETAWCDCRELFDLIKKTYGVQIYYYTEESGCQIFETNDSDGHAFPMRYFIDTERNGIEYCSDFDELADYIENAIGKRPHTFEEIEDMIENENDFYSINEIDVV